MVEADCAPTGLPLFHASRSGHSGSRDIGFVYNSTSLLEQEVTEQDLEQDLIGT